MQSWQKQASQTEAMQKQCRGCRAAFWSRWVCLVDEDSANSTFTKYVCFSINNKFMLKNHLAVWTLLRLFYNLQDAKNAWNPADRAQTLHCGLMLDQWVPRPEKASQERRPSSPSQPLAAPRVPEIWARMLQHQQAAQTGLLQVTSWLGKNVELGK